MYKSRYCISPFQYPRKPNTLHNVYQNECSKNVCSGEWNVCSMNEREPFLACFSFFCLVEETWRMKLALCHEEPGIWIGIRMTERSRTGDFRASSSYGLGDYCPQEIWEHAMDKWKQLLHRICLVTLWDTMVTYVFIRPTQKNHWKQFWSFPL